MQNLMILLQIIQTTQTRNNTDTTDQMLLNILPLSEYKPN